MFISQEIHLVRIKGDVAGKVFDEGQQPLPQMNTDHRAFAVACGRRKEDPPSCCRFFKILIAACGRKIAVIVLRANARAVFVSA